MASFKGKSVRLNKPSRIRRGQTSYGRKKFQVFVKSGSRVKRVTFGDPNLGAHPGDKKRKKAYCARSKNLGSDRTKANYWSRKQWKC